MTAEPPSRTPRPLQQQRQAPVPGLQQIAARQGGDLSQRILTGRLVAEPFEEAGFAVPDDAGAGQIRPSAVRGGLGDDPAQPGDGGRHTSPVPGGDEAGPAPLGSSHTAPNPEGTEMSTSDEASPRTPVDELP